YISTRSSMVHCLPASCPCCRRWSSWVGWSISDWPASTTHPTRLPTVWPSKSSDALLRTCVKNCLSGWTELQELRTAVLFAELALELIRLGHRLPDLAQRLAVMPPSEGQPRSPHPLYPIEKSRPPAPSVFVRKPQIIYYALGKTGRPNSSRLVAMMMKDSGLREICECVSLTPGSYRPIAVLMARRKPVVIQPNVKEDLASHQRAGS